MKVRELKTLLDKVPDDFEIELYIGNFTNRKIFSVIRENDIGWCDKVIRLQGKEIDQ